VTSDSAAGGVTGGTDTIQVFWIERVATNAQGMQDMFEALAGRVHATRVPKVDETTAASQLAASANAAVIPGDNTEKHGRSQCQFTGSDASRLMSHLVAIRLAYTERHERVLVLEDDAVLDNETLSRSMGMIKSAPEDWQILQLSVDYKHTAQWQLDASDVWISWMPDHAGTAAYLINKQGMRSILARTGGRAGVAQADGPRATSAGGAKPPGAAVAEWQVQEPRQVHEWQVQEPCMLMAHELLFYAATTYTAAPGLVRVGPPARGRRPASPQLGASLRASAAAASAAPGALPRAPDLVGGAAGPLAGGVLVVQAISVFGADELAVELSRLRTDALVLKRWHTRSEWRVHLVVTPGSLPVDPAQLSTLASLGVTCYIERHVIGKYNKYRFVAPHVAAFEQWDYVLLKDSDMRISGFPWRTFMAKTASAVAAGPIRQSVEEGLRRHEHRECCVRNSNFNERKECCARSADAAAREQWFQIHQAHRWKRFAPRFVAQVAVVEVPFLEMYFTLFDGKFASFFFHEILSAAFVEGASAWGPDMMWCAAAAEWESFGASFVARVAAGNSSAPASAAPRKGCVLVPVVARHEDSRTIAKSAAQGRGERAATGVEGRPPARASPAKENARALRLFADKPRQAQWMQASLAYRRRFGGTSDKPGLSNFFDHLRAGRRFVDLDLNLANQTEQVAADSEDAAAPTPGASAERAALCSAASATCPPTRARPATGVGRKGEARVGRKGEASRSKAARRRKLKRQAPFEPRSVADTTWASRT
jgi:hypothetical protein